MKLAESTMFLSERAPSVALDCKAVVGKNNTPPGQLGWWRTRAGRSIGIDAWVYSAASI